MKTGDWLIEKKCRKNKKVKENVNTKAVKKLIPILIIIMLVSY